MVNDERQVAKVQAGDIEAYAPLVKKYQARLVNFVYRFVRDYQKAEEIAEDTFVNVYKTIERIDTSRKFSTYLFGAAKNAAISFLRQAKLELPIRDEFNDTGDLYDKIIQNQEAARVRKAVAALASMYRQVVKLYYFDELSYSQMGDELDLSVNTVKTRLRRAKERLAGLLKDETRN